ncbi:hypothetical protein DY000_02060389 [Brassica cretica]|nr:hypothetical protein DY000_02060389 [Brassica cretica]
MSVLMHNTPRPPPLAAAHGEERESRPGERRGRETAREEREKKVLTARVFLSPGISAELRYRISDERQGRWRLVFIEKGKGTLGEKLLYGESGIDSMRLSFLFDSVARSMGLAPKVTSMGKMNIDKLKAGVLVGLGWFCGFDSMMSLAEYSYSC